MRIEYSELIRKLDNEIIVVNDFKIGRLKDYCTYQKLMEIYREVDSKLTEMHLKISHGHYFFGFCTFYPNCENILLVFWINLVYSKIISILTQEMNRNSSIIFYTNFDKSNLHNFELNSSRIHILLSCLTDIINDFKRINEMSTHIYALLEEVPLNVLFKNFKEGILNYD